MAETYRPRAGLGAKVGAAAVVAACILVGPLDGQAEDAKAPICAGSMAGGAASVTATNAAADVLQGGNGARYEQVAADMLALAEAEIASGQVAEGCKLAGVVASTFSGSASARAAARMFGAADAHVLPTSSAGTEGGSASDASAVRWREVVVRATAAQDELRDAVGDRVFFSPGSAELDARAVEAVAAQAGWLARHDGLDIVIEGHADDGIVDSAQLALSESRALAVKRVLVERGLPSVRISLIAFGNSEPIALCDDAQCRAQNRRAVTRLVPGSDGAAR